MDQRQSPFSNPFFLCEPSQDVFPLFFTSRTLPGVYYEIYD